MGRRDEKQDFGDRKVVQTVESLPSVNQGPSPAWHRVGVVEHVEQMRRARQVGAEGAGVQYLSRRSFIRRKSPEAMIKLCWESLRKGQSLVPEAA